MKNSKIAEFIEMSFLKEVPSNLNITDISYNGSVLYADDITDGRHELEMSITSDEVSAFVKQVANLCGKNFSYSEPILDVSFGRFRLNAVFGNTAFFDGQGVVTFSLRIFAKEIRFSCGDDKRLQTLLYKITNGNSSIVVFGNSGSGKTELQKYLVSLYDRATRVVIIDNISELAHTAYPQNLDITYWISGNIATDILVANALRSNASRIIIAEARGAEMLDVFRSALTGHPTIVTLHCLSENLVHKRMVHMCLERNPHLHFESTLLDVSTVFPFLIKTVKETLSSGQIARYIASISVMHEGSMKTIYKRDGWQKKATYNDSFAELLAITNAKKRGKGL